jgi:hypothetical protein
MKRGPQPAIRTRKPLVPPLEKARAAWGAELPPEIEALARACTAETASAVATRLGYSGGLVSHVLAKRYPGDVALVFAKIRGTLMGEVVECPIVGTIPTSRCLTEQKRPFQATNSGRARLFHACKTCPNNRKNQEPGHV